MPSSISGSNAHSHALRHVKYLLATIALLLLGIEAGANYLLKHASPTYARVSGQYQQAREAVPAKPGDPPTVLMLGNSLLLDGIEMDRLRLATSSRMRVYPIFLEATGYYDWLYAVRRLFRQGARPDVIVVGVGVNYFLTDQVGQDYALKLFFAPRDVIAVAFDLPLDLPASSNLLLAHLISFWVTRGAIKNQVLSHVIPNWQELRALTHPHPPILGGQD